MPKTLAEQLAEEKAAAATTLDDDDWMEEPEQPDTPDAFEDESPDFEPQQEERGLQVFIDGVEDTPTPDFVVPDGVTVLRLDKYTATVDRKPKVKAIFAAASSKENLLRFFQSKNELIRLTEPDRDIPRPDTEIFGRIVNYQDTTGEPEMKVVVEFDMTEVILERLSIISFTEPTLVWMWDTHRQQELPQS